MKTTTIFFALLFSILTFYSPCYAQSNTSSETKETREELEAKIKRLEDLVKKLDNDKLAGNNENETAIYHLMSDYLNSRTADERYKYVLHKDKTLSRMQKYYSNGTNVSGTCNFEKKDFVIKGSDITTLNKSIPVLYVSKQQIYYIVKTTKGYAIDWEHGNYYNDVTATDNEGYPVKMNVLIQKCDEDIDNRNLQYFYCHFSKKDGPFWYLCRIQGGKSNPLYNKAVSLCSDGELHEVVVTVVFNPNTFWYELQKISPRQENGLTSNH